MNTLNVMLSHELVWRLGWVLLHSLWQATAVAVMLAVGFRALRGASANARYLMACAALFLMLAAPVATVFLLDPPEPPVADVAMTEWEAAAEPSLRFEIHDTVQQTPATATEALAPPRPPASPPASSGGEEPTMWSAFVRVRLESVLPYLVIAWMLGVCGLSLWHLGGWAQLQRLKRRMVKPVADQLATQVRALAEQLYIRQAVTVVQSALVQVPTVIGWLKPVILLPASALTGLNAGQLEALLAHELAHIRRHDYLVNLLQTANEILGFYHPAVWWVSRRIRLERENCCDDIATRLTGDRARYADALASMEALRGNTGLAMAASGGSLYDRIRRLTGEEPQRPARMGLMPAISATLVVALASVLSFAQLPVSTPDSEQEPLPATETVVDEPPPQPAPEPIELAPAQEQVFQELNLTNPEVIRLVRTLLQPQSRVTANEVSDGVPALCAKYGEEGRRAAAALLNAPYSYVKERLVSALPQDPETAELLLQSAITSWEKVPAKAKRRLGNAMSILFQSKPNDVPTPPLVEEVLALMIQDKGKQVPLRGFELARGMAPESERVRQAAESQRENPEYDYFSNEHPVRRAALGFLGEAYVPPVRESIDYAGISIVQEQGLSPSSGLTIGNLTSLYTATGPCAGGGDKYGWNFQFRGMVAAQPEDEVVGLLHPIGEVDNTPVRRRLEARGRPGVVLNAASPVDLAYCDVVVLTGIYNMRPEVVDALEEYVWNGGGIVTVDGAGIISCDKEEKLAALLDMPSLNWTWSQIKEQRVVETESNPITRGLNLSKVVRPGAFNRNGYTFPEEIYADQVLLRFDPDGAPALRVSSYGKGRIANIGWSPRIGHSPEVREFVHRCMAWAGGKAHADYFPEPVHFRIRYDPDTVSDIVSAPGLFTSEWRVSEPDSTGVTQPGAAAPVRLEFRLAERDPADGLSEAVVERTGEKVWLHDNVELSNEHVAVAWAEGWDSEPVVHLQLTEEGSRRLQELTRTHIHRTLALIVDDRIFSAPQIQEEISGSKIEFKGPSSREEAERIAAGLNAARSTSVKERPYSGPARLNMEKALQEVREHYTAAKSEVAEYVLWTARTFGPSGFWLNEDALEALSGDKREEKVLDVVGLLEQTEYGRHLCPGLVLASALKDERLLPGLMKVAGYHREDTNYDCRAKWMAVAALARQESDRAVPLLISLLDHGNQNTRLWARAALARKSGKDLEQDKEAWTRWWEEQNTGADPAAPGRVPQSQRLDLQLDGEETLSATVTLGQKTMEVVQTLRPAEVFSDDDPVLGYRAADGEVYLLYFLRGDGQPRGNDRLAAVAKFASELPGDPSPQNRRPGVFLLPADLGGQPCPRLYPEVKAMLQDSETE